MLSERKLMRILEQSSDATAIYDSEDLNISFVNYAMLKIWGKDQSVLHQTFGKALPEVADQQFEHILKEVWRSGIAYTASDTCATLEIEGKLKMSYFDFEYLPLIDDNGETYAILHTARDVSARVLAGQVLTAKQEDERRLTEQLTISSFDIKTANDNLSIANRDLHLFNDSIIRLNERLLESETDFRRLVEQAPVAILVFRGADLIIDIVNNAMLQILGKDPGIIGYPLLQGLPEIEGAPAVNMLFEVYHTGKSFDGIEQPVPIMRNGILETRFFNFSYRPLLDNGKIIGVMDIAIEVTEQVLARKRLEQIILEKTDLEEVLRAKEQHLQSILDTMAEGVIIVDNRGKPVYANPMAQKITGLSESMLKNRIYNDEKWQNQRLDGSLLPLEDHPINITLRNGEALYDQEVAILLPSGQKIYISINAAPLVDNQNNITGGIATFTDVSHRRLILQQKDDFISVASHELKTPITSLVGSLQMLDLAKDNMSPHLASELIAQANRSVTKLRNLVNSLLNSNRIIQGRFPVNKKRFTLSHLIKECYEQISNLSVHKMVLTGDLALDVEADEQLIDQVMTNLMNNAVKYAPLSDEIVIHIQDLVNEAKVSITDFGPGIPKEKLPQLFDRYYQATQPQNGLSGLGLGLYISTEIIEKHMGRIGVESVLGHGSTFWFTLPL